MSLSFVLVSQVPESNLLHQLHVVNQSDIDQITNTVKGSILFNSSKNTIYQYNGNDWTSTSNNNWLITGNTGISNNSFLGTTDDIKMQIRSNNTPVLEFGRRSTLGLVQQYNDYTDEDQYLVYLKGDNITCALQFAAAEASFYKPMFFTTTNGSFRLKGSTGKTDLFEIGSAGPDNDGRLEFIIGDDGSEPMVFKRYDYRDGKFHQELFRVQGSDNTASASTRFGININPEHKNIDLTYNDSQTSYRKANSTFEVNGSISTSIIRINSDITLGEEHHTIILTNQVIITLPSASTCKGRIYIIKNIYGNYSSINIYKTSNYSSSVYINSYTTVQLQSDGIDWQQID